MRGIEPLVAACLAALGLAACSGGAGAAPAVAARRSGAELVVRRGTFSSCLLLTGELKASRAQEVSVPRTTEWQLVLRWMEADGAEVKAGQKVVEFDNGPFASSLEQRRLTVERARSELLQQEATGAAGLADKRFAVEKARIAVEKARVEADVPVELMARRDWQDKQLALERARVELEKARDDLSAAERGAAADLAVKRIALEKASRELGAAEDGIQALVITAPRDGIFQVADHPWEGRKLQANDTLWPGIPIGRIPELTEMRVEGYLADVDDGRIAIGDAATCTLDTFPDRSFPARVLTVTPVAQDLTVARQTSTRRGFRVELALERTDPEVMRPGMSVKAEIVSPDREGVLLAPRAAVILTPVVAPTRVPAAAAPPSATPTATPPPAPLATALRLPGGRTVAVRLGPCSDDECVVEEGAAEGLRLAAAEGRT